MNNRRAYSQRLKPTRKKFKLLSHGHEYNNGAELVLNPENFPHIKEGDIIEIIQPERQHDRLILQVESVAPVKGKFQISILKDIAAQFGLEAFHDIVVEKVDPRDVTVEFVELTFKDQFISRADIWRFKVAMYGRSIYIGKNMELLGIRAQVRDVRSSGQQVSGGMVGADTKLILRSRSSRIFWLIQMSTEMWEFADDGEIYLEKLLNKLIKVLLAKWQESSVSHCVTIILFSRCYYERSQFPSGFDPNDPIFTATSNKGFGPGCKPLGFATGFGPSIHMDHAGRYYEDFYKVVVMDYKGPDWYSLMGILKKEFSEYPKTHRWRLPTDFIPAKYTVRKAADGTDVLHWEKLPCGIPSSAVDGNALEAINVTLNILDKHYMDRDLRRTGQSILMVSAGCGVFRVTQRLGKISKQRMMDNGIGMDMISLTTPPLHIVPLFIWRDLDPSEPASTSLAPKTSSSFLTENSPSTPRSRLTSAPVSNTYPTDQNLYNIPHWINISFLEAACSIPKVSDPSKSFCSCVEVDAFTAIPSYRMFDLTAPNDPKLFPVTLKSIMLGSGYQSDDTTSNSNYSFSLCTNSPVPPRSVFGLSTNSHHSNSRSRMGAYSSSMHHTKESADSIVQRISEYQDTINDDIYDDNFMISSPLLQENLSYGSNGSSINNNSLPTGSLEKLKLADYRASPLISTIKPIAPPPSLSLDDFQEYDAMVFQFIPKNMHSKSSPYASNGSNHGPSITASSSSMALNTSSMSKRERKLSLRTSSARKGRYSPSLYKLSGENSSIIAAPGVSGGLIINSPLRNNNNRAPSSITGRRHNSTRMSAPKLRSMHDRTTSEDNIQTCVYSSPYTSGQTPTADSTSVAVNASTSSSNSGKRSPLMSSISSQQQQRKISSSSYTPQQSTLQQNTLHSSTNVDLGKSYEKRFRRNPPSKLLGSHLGSNREAELSAQFRKGTYDMDGPSSSSGVARSLPQTSSSFEEKRMSSAMNSMYSRSSARDIPIHEILRSEQNDTQADDTNENYVNLSQSPKSISSSCGSSHDHCLSPDALLSTSASPNASRSLMTPSAYAKGSISTTNLARLASLSLNHQSIFLVNPFRSEIESDYADKRLTSNRRRWSHLFSSNQLEFRNHASPNWKSLTIPAVLPLTTDFYPHANDLNIMYTESFYTLTLSLPDERTATEIPFYKDHKELVTELICQRLACDFQLVALDAGTEVSSQNRAPAGSTKRGPGGESRDSQSIVYHLSMGHRIHQIIYDEELQTIEVKRYIKRSNDRNAEPFKYQYSLWVPQTKSFHTLRQNFHEIANPEYNWNFLDQLMCGYSDDMPDNTKCRRIGLCIVPPSFKEETTRSRKYQRRRLSVEGLKSTQDGHHHGAENSDPELEEELAYVARFQKFLQFIRSRISKSDPNFSVNVHLSKEKSCYHPRDGFGQGGRNIQRELFKVSLGSTGSGILLPDRQEWLALTLDTDHYTTQLYHLDIRWLACSGNLVDDFVGLILRKCKQNGLDVRQLPEYIRHSRLHIHPCLAPVFFPIQLLTNNRGLDTFLLNELNFIFDDVGMADNSGLGCGLGIEEIKRERGTMFRRFRLSKEALSEKHRTRGYRQYMHRKLPVFVRVIHMGILWIPQHECDSEGDAQLAESVLSELKQFIERTTAVQETLEAIVNASEELVRGQFDHTKDDISTVAERQDMLLEDTNMLFIPKK